MIMEKINTPLCLSISGTKPTLETTLLTRGTDDDKALLFPTFGEAFEKKHSIWIIEPDENTSAYRIKSYDSDEYITVQESNDEFKTIVLVEKTEGSNEQLWNLLANSNGLFILECVAYADNFLSKVLSSVEDGPSVMLSPEKEEDDSEAYVLNEWYLTEVNQILLDARMLSPQKINPAITFSNTTLDYIDAKECLRKLDKKGDDASCIFIKLNIPFTYPSGNEALNLVMGLEHFGSADRDNIWTSIDIKINGNDFLSGYTIENASPFLSQFSLNYDEYSGSEEIDIQIRLSEESAAAYWIRNIVFHMEGFNVSYGQFITQSLQYPTSGLLYKSVESSDDDTFIIFKNKVAEASIIFSYPDQLAEMEGAYALIALNHAFSAEGGKINLHIDDTEYLMGFDFLHVEDFSLSFFKIPLDKIEKKDIHKFTVSLTEEINANYFLLNASIKIFAPLPEVSQEGYDNYVKNWILSNRKNIAELNQIPRDDLSAWEFISNAPAWFYLPYLPASPTEISVLLKHFPLNFINVAFEVKDINSMARVFRNDLLKTDIVRKNAYRHIYWMALITNHLGKDFAYDLGNAHESAHVDLTIEGPFDHVTDKINNLIGINIAMKNNLDDIPELLNKLWDENKLAWCKNFRVEDGKQIADVNWKKPLDYLYNTFSVQPEFNEWEKIALEKNNVIVHDEL